MGVDVSGDVSGEGGGGYEDVQLGLLSMRNLVRENKLCKIFKNNKLWDLISLQVLRLLYIHIHRTLDGSSTNTC